MEIGLISALRPKNRGARMMDRGLEAQKETVL
jgi:hypothetical protein